MSRFTKDMTNPVQMNSSTHNLDVSIAKQWVHIHQIIRSKILWNIYIYILTWNTFKNMHCKTVTYLCLLCSGDHMTNIKHSVQYTHPLCQQGVLSYTNNTVYSTAHANNSALKQCSYNKSKFNGCSTLAPNVGSVKQQTISRQLRSPNNNAF